MKPVVLGLLGIGIAALAAGGYGATRSVQDSANHEALKSNDLTGIRKEALARFPRGTPLDRVTGDLSQLGFQCDPVPRKVGDISGPALVCASNGRGYPDYPAVNLTVSTRNGLVSEIEVWNVMQRSDTDTPRGGFASDEPTGTMVGALEERER